MAIDSNVLLRAIVPNTTAAIQGGVNLGQTIRNAPLLREQRQNAIQQQEQQLATGDVEMGDKLSSAVYSLVGDVESLMPEQVRPLMNQLQASGFAVEEDDFSEDPENISNIMGLAKRGKSLSQTGGKQFADKAVFAERINPETGEAEQGFAVRDSQGTRFEGIDGEVITELPEDKRQRDLQAKIDAEEEITKIKNSGAAQGEQNKKLGVERAKIGEGVRAGARQANRSKSNLLRLKRALSAANTGRLAVARDLAGTIIPSVKDADAEVFNSLATQYALDELSRQSGTKTDFDFQKAAETQARLGNTKEANEAILTIALDRLDELELEDRQFKKFVKGGGNAEDFSFKPVPLEFVQLIRANPKNEQMKKDFKDKYGYLPTGL